MMVFQSPASAGLCAVDQLSGGGVIEGLRAEVEVWRGRARLVLLAGQVFELLLLPALIVGWNRRLARRAAASSA